MSDEPRVVGISGSLRDGSYTETALTHALLAAEDAGATTELVDLRAYDLPLFDPDLEDEAQGDAVLLKRNVREADGVVLGSPVYHGSYSSAFRNVHDYCGFDEYEDTVVGLLVVAGGGTIASTLDHMRVTVRGVHGWVVPHQVGIRNASRQFEDAEEPLGSLADGTPVETRFVDEGMRERVTKLGRQVVENLRTGSPGGAASASADD
jgi:NAD(P)H-dependent FMN reductase